MATPEAQASQEADAEILAEDIDDDLKSFEQDELVKQALTRGVDLREYGKHVDDELRQVERASILDYIQEAEDLAELHSQIKSCDGILDNMESMLSGFQGDLASISAEIKHLQDESISMNVRLRNRKAVEARLSDFIDHAVIPPALVTNICTAEVDEAYVEHVLELNEKVRFAKQESAQKTLAYRDMEADITRLRTRAAQRMRDFLLQKIGTLRKRMTNVQILQQAVLLKFKALYAFLLEHAPDKAAEVLEAYNTTMSGIFLRHFRAHVADLTRLRTEAASARDVIGDEAESVSTSFFGKSAARGEGPFRVGDRASVLEEAPTPIIPAIVQSSHKALHEEHIWSSVLTLLVDTVCSEANFCRDFFGASNTHFDIVFGKTLFHLMEHVEAFLAGTHDAIGCLLLVRVTLAHDALMRQRGVDALSAFLDHVGKLMWDRFFTAVEHQQASIVKTATPPPATLDVHPMPVVRRYAEFAASLQLLATGSGVEQRVLSASSTLRSAMQALLVARLAGVLKTNRKKQAIFLINNADTVIQVFAERGAVGDDLRLFEELLDAHKSAFVEEVLADKYGRLIRFVKATEQPLASGGVAAVRALPEHGQLEAIVKEFHASWQQGIAAINVEVMQSFANFKNGMEILKQTLTQLLLYHTRFLDIVKQLYPEGGPFAKYMITIATIMAEIKNYSRNF